MDEDHATATSPPPVQLGITVTASLCITAVQFRQSTNFSNGRRIFQDLSFLRGDGKKYSELNNSKRYRHFLKYNFCCLNFAVCP
jgi:hypothetical protein